MEKETINILNAIGGIAAFLAAFISWRALLSTQRNSEAQLVLEFLKEYSSSEMLDSLRILRHYKDNYGENFHNKWLKDIRDNSEEAKLVDKARRKVSHYFQKGHSLYKAGYVKKKFITTAMLVDGIGIFLEINKPLEIALGASPEQDTFIFYESVVTSKRYIRRVFSRNA